mgnify:CR=1 FL=1
MVDTNEESKKDVEKDKTDITNIVQQKLLEENRIKPIFNEKVRVLIMTQGYQSIYHAKLTIVQHFTFYA